MRSLEAANSEALSAKQNAASLQMDLAGALDKQQSVSVLANSRLEAAVQRQQALEEELHWREQNTSVNGHLQTGLPKETTPHACKNFLL